MKKRDNIIIDIDNSLIRNFQIKNDEKSFSELIIKYKDRVFNLCYRYLGDYDEASDCAQEVFIKLYDSIRKFRFESKFSTWLYAVCINTCRNWQNSLSYRRKKSALRISSMKTQEKNSIDLEIEDKSDDPGEIMEKKEVNIIIQQAIDTLRGKQRSVLILRDIEGRSYEEIAIILKLNSGTVKSSLARARFKLAKLIKSRI